MMNEKEREVLRRSVKESEDIVAKGNETFKEEEEQNNTNESRPKLIILANNIKGMLK